MEKNKSQMVTAFKELLSSNFLEPLIALEDLRKAFYDEIELVTFACNV